MIRPEKNPFNHMMDLGLKFYKDEELTVDSCAGALAIANAC